MFGFKLVRDSGHIDTKKVNVMRNFLRDIKAAHGHSTSFEIAFRNFGRAGNETFEYQMWISNSPTGKSLYQSSNIDDLIALIPSIADAFIAVEAA